MCHGDRTVNQKDLWRLCRVLSVCLSVIYTDLQMMVSCALTAVVNNVNTMHHVRHLLHSPWISTERQHPER